MKTTVESQYIDCWKGDKKDGKRLQALLQKTGDPSLIRNPDLLEAMVNTSPVETDMWDTLRFLKAASPRRSPLTQSVQTGEDVYAPYKPLAQQVWATLFDGKATMKTDDPDPAPAWYGAHKELIEKLTETPAYKNLAAKTKYRPMLSSAAMLSLQKPLLELVQAMQKEPPPNGGNEGSDGDKDDNENNNGDGAPQPPTLTDEQLKALAAAIEQANKDTNKADAALKAAGMEPPLDEDLDPAAYLDLADKLTKNRNLKNILSEVGRIKRVATSAAKRDVSGTAGFGSERFYGDRLDLLPQEEIIKLGCPEMEEIFLAQLVAGELPQQVEYSKAPIGRGPIVFCVDESGSMGGEQLKMAKALTLASIRVAKEHSRKSWAISFCTECTTYNTTAPKGLQDFLTSYSGGGTDFTVAVTTAQKLIQTEAAAKQADILFITDGCSNVDSAVVKSFNRFKKATGARMFVVGVAVDKEYLTRSLGSIADHVITIANLSDADEINKGFGSFWEALSDTPDATRT